MIGYYKKFILIALPTMLTLMCSGANLPNVVMIMSDDWGWSEIAAYRRYQGLNDPIPTPNLDRMVAEGIMFTDAHAPAALCAPTRFSMMTGSNPYRNGVQWGTWSFEKPSAFAANRRHITDLCRHANSRATVRVLLSMQKMVTSSPTRT